MVFAAVGFSVPIFWLGFILIWVFGLWAFGMDNPLLPVAGYVKITDDLLGVRAPPHASQLLAWDW